MDCSRRATRLGGGGGGGDGDGGCGSVEVWGSLQSFTCDALFTGGRCNPFKSARYIWYNILLELLGYSECMCVV